MKKFLLILLILFLCGCSSNSDRITKSTNDTIENISKVSKISYDTVVIKSKKVEYKLIKHKPIILNETTPSGGGNPIIYKHDVITKPPVIYQPTGNLVNTREKRLLEVTPNIESISKNLTGRLNYVMSDTMEVGLTYIISVSISKNMTKNEVISKVSSFKSVNNHSTELIDTIIRVTPKMSVNLKEVGTEKNFHIDTLTPTIQKIELEDTTLTQWQWRVTPIKDGNKVLTISVNLYIGKVEKNLEIYDGKIYVHMNHKIWVLIGNFFVNYWQWLCSGAIFPFLIWIFKVYIQPKFKKKKE